MWGEEARDARIPESEEKVNEKIFPTILMVLDLCAALAYIPKDDWRKVVYWIAACVLTGVVTW